MTVKEFLCQAHNIEVKISRMRDEVEEYKRLAASIPGCNFDNIRVSGTKSNEAPFVKWVIKQIDKEEQIKKLEEKLAKVKGDILLAIDTLENTNHRLCLVYRYLEWLSWDDIGKKMYASRSTLNRWHEQALGLIKI